MDYFVALDAGHGIMTSGKRTFKFSDGTVMKEWEFNSDVMHRVFKKLIPYTMIDVFVVNSEKYDVTLDTRNERINEAWQEYQNILGKNNVKGVLVSIHANAEGSISSWGTANGTATFYYPTNMTDKDFAEVIQKNLIAQTGLKPHRGGVVGGNFQILRDSKITACLCECAFMTNLKEAELLRSDDFREKCADGIANGLLEYFEISKIGEIEEKPKEEPKKEIDKTVRYKKYNSKTYELRGDVGNLGVKIVNKSNRSIVEPNCVNGTFFWHTDNPNIKYSTSILYVDGKVYQATANHLPYPQSVYIVYKNEDVDMKQIKNLSELDLDKIRLAIGGVGIRNTLDKTFMYNPSSEGFTGVYADVLRKSNKTFIGYNKRLNKQYLLVLKNVTMEEAIRIISDNSLGEAFDICLMIDGGGSPFLNNATDMIIYGDGRIIHHIIGFGL